VENKRTGKDARRRTDKVRCGKSRVIKVITGRVILDLAIIC
jgi:hypothetical protein